MAIIIRGKSECSLCGQVLADGDDLVATTHFIHHQSHPLWRYSDSAMHRTCFAKWPEANAFRAAFNQIWPELVPQHPRHMLADGSIAEGLDPDRVQEIRDDKPRLTIAILGIVAEQSELLAALDACPPKTAH